LEKSQVINNTVCNSGMPITVQASLRVRKLALHSNRSYRFDASTIEPDPHNRITVYKASNGDDSIAVTITGTSCQDSMSGETFSATVSVVLNNKRYSGCGRALH
jgi:uncharacterized membrane protein